jgi:hypothetical protein
MSDIYQRENHVSYEMLSPQERVEIANRVPPLRPEERLRLILLDHGVPYEETDSAIDALEIEIDRASERVAAVLVLEMLRRMPTKEARAMRHALGVEDDSLRADAKRSGISAPGFLKLVRRLKAPVNASP